MKRKKNRSTASIIGFTIFGVVFVALAVLSTSLREYSVGDYFIVKNIVMSQSLFWIFLSAAIVLWGTLLRALLVWLGDQGKLPAALLPILHFSLKDASTRVFSKIQMRMENLGFRLLLYGVYIFLAVTALSAIGLFQEKELLLLQVPTPRSRTPEVENPAVAILSFGTRDNNQERYLKGCLKIVNDLKRVGAKAVLIDLRSVSTYFAETNIELVRQLAESGIVVFGLQPGYGLRLANVKSDNAPIIKGTFGLQFDQRRSPFIHEVRPIEWIQFGGDTTFGAHRNYDVMFELIRMYRGEETLPTFNGRTLVYGDQKIRLTDNYTFYTRGYFGGRPFLTGVMADDGIASDGFQYTVPSGSREGNMHPETLDELAPAFRDKIVILGWVDYGSADLGPSFFYPHAYAWAIQSLLDGNYLRLAGGAHLLLSAILLILAVYLTLRLRLLMLIVTLFALSIGVLALGLWLFQTQNLIIHIAHPLAAMLVTMALFPAVKLAHALRVASEEEDRFSQPVILPESVTAQAGIALRDATESKEESERRTFPGIPGKRLSLDWATAFVLSLLLVGLSVGASALWFSSKRPVQPAKPKEVYIMTLPTVEVQGYRIPNEVVAQ